MIDYTRSQTTSNALDLMEEALTLLRGLPLSSLASGFVGSLPFTFVFLLYLLNLVHNPRASEELVGYSTLLALLYIWLRVWQSVFSAELWHARSGTSVFGWSAKEWLPIVRHHAVLSPLSLISLLVSAVLIFPFVWTYALHHNLALLVNPAFSSTRTGKKEEHPLSLSWRQARLWPGSNQLILLLLMLLYIVVFVNFMSMLLIVPYLVKFLTGWESTFTRLGIRLLDLKIFVAAGALSYLAVSPVIRAVYVLRCFYGLSLKTGEDLASDLRQARRTRAATLVLGLIFCLAGSTAFLQAGPAPAAGSGQLAVSFASLSSPQPIGTRSVPELDRSIDAVLKSPKHLWHAPQGAHKGQSGLFRDFTEAVQKFIDKVIEWILTVRRWLWPDNQPGKAAGNRRSWIDIKTAATALLILTVGILLFVVVRMILDARRNPKTARAVPISLTPDLTTADLNPAELPEEGWLRLAAEMVDRGELRLAVRAVYLAALACLGERQLITAARFKSNRDYLRELQRKARGKENLVESFQPMMWMFERVWYGTHQSSTGELDEMRRLLEGLRISGT